MYYYIINNRIYEFESPADPTLYNYPQLTVGQVEFYLLHNKNISVQEVLNMQINQPYEPTLAEVKANKLAFFSQRSFDVRNAIVPDYKLINGALGVYGETVKTAMAQLVIDFRNEYYRLKGLVDNYTFIEEVELLVDEFESIEYGG